jgi:flagellar protein FlgJ
MNITPPPLPPSVGPRATSQPDIPADLRKAAEGFEALFLSLMLKAGRAGLPGDDLTGGSAVRSTTDLLDAQLARDAAGRSGFGIADAVARQFAGYGPKP